MKKILLYVFLSLFLSGNLYSKDLRLICTHNDTGLLDVVQISGGIGKAIVLFLNERITTGLVDEYPHKFRIVGEYPSPDYKILSPYEYFIDRNTGVFKSKIFFNSKEINFSGTCKEQKAKF